MKSATQIFCLTLFLLNSASAGETHFRTWTDKHGRKLEEKFIELKGDQVRLERRDGREITLSMEMLSKQGQARLEPKSGKKGFSITYTELESEIGHGNKEICRAKVDVAYDGIKPYEGGLRICAVVLGQEQRQSFFDVIAAKSFSSSLNKKRQKISLDEVRYEVDRDQLKGSMHLHGYCVLLVESKSGKILKILSEPLRLRTQAERLLKCRQGDQLDENYIPLMTTLSI